MRLTADIYKEVGDYLLGKEYYNEEFEVKKALFDEALKNYINLKLQELQIKPLIENNNQELGIIDMINILVTNSLEDEDDIVSSFTHCILNFMGNMQGWSITWYVEDDTHLPLLTIDENGNFNSLTTCMNSSPITVFAFVYEAFQHEFTQKNIPKIKMLEA